MLDDDAQHGVGAALGVAAGEGLSRLQRRLGRSVLPRQHRAGDVTARADIENQRVTSRTAERESTDVTSHQAHIDVVSRAQTEINDSGSATGVNRISHLKLKLNSAIGENTTE